MESKSFRRILHTETPLTQIMTRVPTSNVNLMLPLQSLKDFVSNRDTFVHLYRDTLYI